MKKMPPQKKKEKETRDAVASSHNGSIACANNNNNSSAVANNNHINGNSAEAVSGIATVAAATSTAVSTATSTEQSKLNNSHQQEQELFLQAFEKPTQIYRFLRNRHGTSPIFLERTLSYMKERMSRNHRKRNNFKINSMLDVLSQKSQTLTNNYLNIIYNGLFEKTPSTEHTWQEGDVVAVESTLYKITKSKRKDSTSDFQEILTHSSGVTYNPLEDMEKLCAISIPAQCLNPLGEQHTIYKLLFRIKVKPMGQDSIISNGTSGNEDTPKRQKLSKKLYGCELIIYEKNSGCIPEGDYEAALQELNSSSIKSFSPKKRSWETLPDNYIPITMKFDVFTQYPTLKFRLTWSANELPKELSSKEMNKYCTFADIANGIGCENTNTTNNNDEINHNNNCIKGTATTKNNDKSVSGTATETTISKPMAKTEKIQIVYNFLYSNNTRQQTEYTQEVICPWCGLDCMRLYSLLKHLKLCHARFNFTYQPAAQNGARIDVTINDSYDGSYAGSPYDLAGPSGCSFARTCGPVRRTTVTNLLVCRPRRQKTCLDEFMVLDEDDMSNQRPYITGHNRLYHHTETCLPVHPKELDIDSEGESDPLWLRQKTIQMIDEFTDVNEGEKELMKLWNLHVMKHGYVGDCQLPLACEMFLDANGHEIIRRNIYRNFILHMCSLFDYGLVSPEALYKTVQKLQGILSKYREGQELMSKQRETQLKYWLEVGILKQDEQKLKSPQKSISLTLSNAGNTLSLNKHIENTKMSESKKCMQPPTKRSSLAVKRSSVNINVGVNSVANEKLANGKSVARKSANQDDDAKEKSNSLKRTANGDKKMETKAKTDLETKTQAAKRRLSTRDTQQPASKRQRNESNTNTGNSNSNSSNNNNSNIAQKNMLNQKQESTIDTMSTAITGKRLATRRQSIAGVPSDANHGNARTHDKAVGKNSSSSGSTIHTLRTRLSVPLNNKAEKR